jgi:hypothetical protein
MDPEGTDELPSTTLVERAPSASAGAVPEAPPPAESLAARIEAAWDEIVGAWFAAQIANSPVSQSTPALNHLAAALPALRQAILEHI